MKVVEHSLQDLAAGDGGQVGLGARPAEGHAAQAGEQLFAVEARALLKRIDVDRLLGLAAAHNEVAREADAIAAQAHALGDLHVDQRERDGDAGTALHHAVQVAIFGRGVFASVPVEAVLDEQPVGNGVGQLARVETVADGFADSFADQVELRSRAMLVHGMAAEGGDCHRPAEQVNVLVGPGDRRRELVTNFTNHVFQYTRATAQVVSTITNPVADSVAG